MRSNKYYELQNQQFGTLLNLYGNHSDSTIPNGNKISLYPRTNNMDQQFRAEWYANAVKVTPQRNAGYVLNRHSGDNSVIAWPGASASLDDTEIDFITINAAQNLYRLKLSRLNLYLTATGSQGICYWRALNGSNTQVFKLLDPGTSGGGGGGINMPVNLNQKYRDYSPWIYKYGCAVCCGVDLASWKHNTSYGIANFSGYYQENSSGYSWSGPNGFSAALESTLHLNEAQTIARIRSYVQAGTPVACHAVGSGGSEHWFVAYAASGTGTTWGTCGINVLDPATNNTNSYNGRNVSISDAMSFSSVTLGIDKIRIPN